MICVRIVRTVRGPRLQGVSADGRADGAAESQTKEECELFSFAASRAKHCRGKSEPDAAVDNVRKRESAAAGGTSDKMAQSPERRPDLPPARILPPIQRQPLKGQV